jgi:hypothetical protein
LDVVLSAIGIFEHAKEVDCYVNVLLHIKAYLLCPSTEKIFFKTKIIEKQFKISNYMFISFSLSI